MRNEASRGWLFLSITSIDFALMPPVKLCRAGKAVIERGKGDGLGWGVTSLYVHVAQLQYTRTLATFAPPPC